MEYGNSNTIVCINNSKDASLYFKEVIPLNFAEIIPWTDNGDIQAADVLIKILPKSLLDSSNTQGLSKAIQRYSAAYMNVFPAVMGIDVFKNNEYFEQRTKALFPSLMIEKENLVNSLPKPINGIFGANNLSNDYLKEDPAFILSGLNLVDTSQMMWKQIIELREDEESVKNLRRLRTFIYENYNGKPISFINDDLANRIDIYESTAKKWGLKTRDSILKIVFNSGTAVATTAATIASIYSGVPISVSLPLGIGSTFLVGNIGLEISSYKRDLQNFKNENPITYLIDIKKKSEIK